MSENPQSALQRAEHRLQWCRQARQGFETTLAEPISKQDARLLRKLKEDERKAQVDASWATHAMTKLEGD